ncbi:hypothetical protein ACJIZ3_011210 [Penstemon smallii]|uniref:Uncharacterized protein n=1 Tax=Penstemon smallii TaxID=265156 RepID=A0ABD3ULP0_9LAMI
MNSLGGKNLMGPNTTLLWQHEPLPYMYPNFPFHPS